jgi:branched-chain amino acid transport system substrate-binding protein
LSRHPGDLPVTELTPLRVGVLAPASNFIPFLAGDLVAALELGFREAQLPVEISVEYAGYNADRGLLISKAQQLLVTRQVNCLVAPLNVALFEALAGPCESQSVPLVALSLGEDPCFESAERPNVFVSSFNLWRTAWMCGFVGAKRFGPRAAILAGLHEGGYGTSFAFPLGLEANGGTLLRIAITHQSSRTEDPTPSIASVLDQSPDFIFAQYAGKEAASFLEAYAALGVKVPLVGFPFLNQRLTRPNATSRLVSLSAWPPTSPVDEKLRIATKHDPQAYSLLAYETGHLISDAVRRTKGPDPSGDGFLDALGAARFDGPRGLTRFGSDGGDSSLYLRDPLNGEETVEEVPTPPKFAEQYELSRRRMTKQGWVNPYLCA